MKKVIKYLCEECGKEYKEETEALACETQNRKDRKDGEIRNKRHKKFLEKKGLDEWYEDGPKTGIKVDPKKFGPHKYADHDGTSDCKYGCGCWMGPTRSGGKVNPFGACPNNPKKKCPKCNKDMSTLHSPISADRYLYCEECKIQFNESEFDKAQSLECPRCSNKKMLRKQNCESKNYYWYCDNCDNIILDSDRKQT